jgi:hypothetical protein
LCLLQGASFVKKLPLTTFPIARFSAVPPSGFPRGETLSKYVHGHITLKNFPEGVEGSLFNAPPKKEGTK